MTHPSSPPAPMTAERIDRARQALMARIADLFDSRAQTTWSPIVADPHKAVALVEERDALTARVAELERERDAWQAEMDEKISEAEEAAEQHREWPAWAKGILKDLTGLGYQYDAGEDIDLRGDFIDHVNEWMRGIERDWKDRASKAEAELAAARGAFDLSESERQRLAGRITALESELAAARKVEDGNVADVIGWLRDTASGLFSPDAHYGAQLTKAADLLTRLSAALKEAGQRASDHLRASEILNRHCVRLEARAQAAEAKLETARRDALEEAASFAAEYGRAISKGLRRSAGPNDTGEQIATAIRALQTKDTTP